MTQKETLDFLKEQDVSAICNGGEMYEHFMNLLSRFTDEGGKLTQKTSMLAAYSFALGSAYGQMHPKYTAAQTELAKAIHGLTWEQKTELVDFIKGLDENA